MSAPALVVLADMTQKGQPVSAEMLVGEFIVVFFIAAFITITRAEAASDRSPVKLGVILGLITAFVAVVLTIWVSSSSPL